MKNDRWKRTGIWMMAGFYSFLLGSILEAVRAIAMFLAWRAENPLGILPKFFVQTLSSPERWSVYPVYIEIFFALFLIYWIVNYLGRRKSLLRFSLATLFFCCCQTLLAGVFLLVFLMTIYVAIKCDCMAIPAATGVSKAIHYTFLGTVAAAFFALCIRIIRSVRR